MRTASSTISPTCPQNTRHHRLHHIPAPGRHATAASGTARRCRGTPAAAECGRSPAGPSALSARCARSASRRRPSGAGAPCEHRRLRLVPPSGSQLGHYRHGAAHVQRAGVGSSLEPRQGWCRGSACAPLQRCACVVVACAHAPGGLITPLIKRLSSGLLSSSIIVPSGCVCTFRPSGMLSIAMPSGSDDRADRAEVRPGRMRFARGGRMRVLNKADPKPAGVPHA